MTTWEYASVEIMTGSARVRYHSTAGVKDVWFHKKDRKDFEYYERAVATLGEQGYEMVSQVEFNKEAWFKRPRSH